MRGNRGRLGPVVSAAVLLAAALSGCAGPAFISAHVCLPTKLVVEPGAASAGDVVTVSSGPVHCDLGYGEEHSYRLTVRQGTASSPPSEAAVRADGAFTTSIRIPAGFAPGDAWIVVDGSTYDQCDDTGAGSCAGYAATITVR